MVVSNYQEIINSWWEASTSKQTGNLHPHHNRKTDRHKLDRKTRYWRDFLKSENYHLISLENLIQKNLLSGGREKEIEKLLNRVFLTLHRPKKKFKSWSLTRANLKKNLANKNTEQLKSRKSVIWAEILGKWTIPWLTDLVKIYYLNQQNQKSYFLLNTYQKPNILSDLTVGSKWKIGLVNGVKQKFFDRVIG